MTHLPLARKYRPKSFKELIGQEATAKALTNGIRLDRIPAGVIFSGTRGIGKTSLARLYAKALTCSSKVQDDPCNECQSCLAINRGTHEDVLEIDGASNNGVEEVRSLQETITYVPQRSKFKVYIVDEVHMLSISAFNALLKTLEEPPKGIVFIFATTEIQKVPQTISSRCQGYQLQKIYHKDIADRLCSILDQENISYEKSAVERIAKQGKGSLRDALTFLDQIVVLGENKVSNSVLHDTLGNLSSEVYFEIIKALSAKDSELCLNLIEKLDENSLDLTEALTELIKFIRCAFIVKSLKEESARNGLKDIPSEDYEQIKDLCKEVNQLDLHRIFRTLIQCVRELDGSELDRPVVENYCLEWCLDPGLPSIDDLLECETQVQQKQISSVNTKQVNSNQQKEISKGQFSKAFLNKQTFEKKPEYLSKSAKLKNLVNHETTETKEKNNPVSIKFPNSWEGLLSAWKKEKPLQARKLEEARAITYSPDLIKISADSKSLVGKTLLQKSTQEKLYTQFEKLFCFKGKLEVVEQKQNERSEENQERLPESILEKKERLDTQNKNKQLDDAKKHPMTQSMIQEFNGTVVKAELKD